VPQQQLCGLSSTTKLCQVQAHIGSLLTVSLMPQHVLLPVLLQGDLKPCNVLIKHVQGAPYGRVALVSDFGLSRALQVGQSHRSTRTFGTLNHTPPELLRLGRLSPAGACDTVLTCAANVP
jgi:serine/threonine protein kinase